MPNTLSRVLKRLSRSKDEIPTIQFHGSNTAEEVKYTLQVYEVDCRASKVSGEMTLRPLLSADEEGYSVFRSDDFPATKVQRRQAIDEFNKAPPSSRLSVLSSMSAHTGKGKRANFVFPKDRCLMDERTILAVEGGWPNDNTALKGCDATSQKQFSEVGKTSPVQPGVSTVVGRQSPAELISFPRLAIAKKDVCKTDHGSMSTYPALTYKPGQDSPPSRLSLDTRSRVTDLEGDLKCMRVDLRPGVRLDKDSGIMWLKPALYERPRTENGSVSQHSILFRYEVAKQDTSLSRA